MKLFVALSFISLGRPECPDAASVVPDGATGDADAVGATACERAVAANPAERDAASLTSVSSELCLGLAHRVPTALQRAPAGDSLCAGRDDCYMTSGSPAGGCPNTCSCLCVCGLCFQDMCTLVPGCSEPPVYR